MLAYIVYQILGSDFPFRDLLAYYDLILTGILAIALVVWLKAGVWVVYSLKAWYQRCDIGLEWSKSRRWIPHLAYRKKGNEGIRELDDGRPIETRRQAMGTDPHGVSWFIFPSEFGGMVSPTEADGLRYYSVDDWFWGVRNSDGNLIPVEPLTEDEETKLRNSSWCLENPTKESTLRVKEQNWSDRRVWMRYPDHMVNVDEFVQHQEIDIDPMTVEAYGEYRDLEARKEFQNPWQTLQANAWWVIPFTMVLLIAYMVMSQQMACSTSTEQIQACAAKLVEYGSQCAEAGKSLTSGTGGVVK